MMLENYRPKIVDKETFIKYYSNNTLRKFIDDMEKICETFKGLNASKNISNMLKPRTLSAYSQCIAQKGAAYMLDLPIGKKAKSILAKAADNLVQRKKSEEGYKNIILVLEDLVNGYRGLFNDAREKIILFKLFKENSLY